ncbi:hypothetical protein ACQUFY_11915 [Robbsia andropogonis]|uniref:hypothetical protein n=1 Tax=Robbsia andropogonis TaxID=28092 RepID=UPI003D21A12C
MSALDDIIARDAGGGQPSALDAIIARDSGGAVQATPKAPQNGGAAEIQAQQQATQAPAQGAAPATFLSRVGQGIADPLNGGAQLLVHALPSGMVDAVNRGAQAVDDLPVVGGLAKAIGIKPATADQVDKSIANQEQQYQASRTAAGQSGFDGARILGNVVGTAPLMFGLGGAPAGALAGAATGAGAGAINGVLTPVVDPSAGSYWDQKLGQAGLGAVSGGIAAPLAKVVTGAISGAGGAAQRALADAGVTMTPGQILGGGLARTEEKLSSVPVLGDLIKNAQQRAVNSFNSATYNQVLAPLGKQYSGPIGNEGVEAVKSTISDAYDKALSNLKFNAADPGFRSSLMNLAGMAQSLPLSQQQQFSNILKTQIFGKLGPQGLMDGQTLKGVQNELTRQARGMMGDPSYDTRQLGAAVSEVKNAVEASLSRTNPADAVKGLQDANAAYANFVRLRSAAGSQGAGNNGGVFTAAQLNNAVRTNDKSVGKGNFATGNALMQDFSSAGQQVLGARYPDSGTAGRSMLALLGGALAGHQFLPAGAEPYAALGGAVAGLGALPYTKAGQRLAQALLMSRPGGAQQVSNAVTKFGIPLAPALGNALLNGPGNQ